MNDLSFFKSSTSGALINNAGCALPAPNVCPTMPHDAHHLLQERPNERVAATSMLQPLNCRTPAELPLSLSLPRLSETRVNQGRIARCFTSQSIFPNTLTYQLMNYQSRKKSSKWFGGLSHLYSLSRSGFCHPASLCQAPALTMSKHHRCPPFRVNPSVGA